MDNNSRNLCVWMSIKMLSLAMISDWSVHLTKFHATCYSMDTTLRSTHNSTLIAGCMQALWAVGDLCPLLGVCLPCVWGVEQALCGVRASPAWGECGHFESLVCGPWLTEDMKLIVGGYASPMCGDTAKKTYPNPASATSPLGGGPVFCTCIWSWKILFVETS